VAAFATSAVLQALQIIYRNLSTSQANGRASLTKLRPKKTTNNYKGKEVFFIDITVARSWKVRAGQYVNLWMPFFSLRSLFQSHPYMIVYWTRGTSLSLCLLVEAQGGLTRKIFERAYEVDSFQMKPGEERHIPLENFHRAWLSGPHGSGAPVGEYGSVLMIATGIGIAAQLPYLKELISGFNYCQVRTRRIHLVWQVDRIGKVAGPITALQ
jgi:NAD(P)H-flavin reductase